MNRCGIRISAQPQFLTNRDDEDAFKSILLPFLLQRARDGNVSAMVEMGDCFLTLRKWGPAAAWYRKAAQSGHVHSRLRLALLAYRGLARMDDLEMVRCFFDFSKNNSTARFMMGECYRLGRGVPQQSFDAAVRWYVMADPGFGASRRRLDSCAAFFQVFPDEYSWAYSIDTGQADGQLRLGMTKTWQKLSENELAEGLRRFTAYEMLS